MQTKENIDIFRWLKMNQTQVLNTFHNVPKAFSDGKKQERFVYIEGTRPDKALIVAHADTVWYGQQIDFEEVDGVVVSKNKKQEIDWNNKVDIKTINAGVGIGADDRAGCSIAWEFVGSGHSVLITSGEEIGAIASKRIMTSSWWRQEIKKHSFAVQFDRRNSEDLVFYNVGTNTFADYCQKETNYKPQSGFSTDIKFLCKDICGVNLSVGYYKEHTPDEKLVLAEYQKTLDVAKNWLLKENLPRFERNDKDEFHFWKNNACGYEWDDSDFYYQSRKDETDKMMDIIPFKEEEKIGGPIIVCKNCGCIFPQEEWFDNYFICNVCKKET